MNGEHNKRDLIYSALDEGCRQCREDCGKYDGFLPDCEECLLASAGRKIKAALAINAVIEKRLPVTEKLPNGEQWFMDGELTVEKYLKESDVCEAIERAGEGANGWIADELERIEPACVVPVPRWIPVSERLPSPGVPVIVARPYDAGPLKVEQGVYLGASGWWKVHGANVRKVLYWMPLPVPPENGTDGKL